MIDPARLLNPAGAVVDESAEVLYEQPLPDGQITEEEALAQGEDFYRNAWDAFKFTWPFMRPYYSKTLLVGLFDFCLVLLALVPPWIAKYLIDQAFPHKDWHLAWVLVFATIAVAFVTQVVTGARAFMWGYTEVRLPLDLRKRIYRHLQNLSITSIEARPVGQQLYRTTVDVDRLSHTLTRIVPSCFYFAEFTLLVTFASYVDPVITWIVLLFLIPWTILFWWVTTVGRELDRRRLWLAEMRDSAVQQGVSTFALIKSFAREKHEFHKFTRRTTAVQRVGVNGYIILVFFEFATQKVLPYAKSVTIFLYFARKVVLGSMSLGMTVPMTAYLTRLNFPLERIVNFGNWIRQIMISAERIMQVLQAEPAIKDLPNAKSVGRLKGHVSFQALTFERPAAGTVLKDIDLDLKPGTTTAIVGPSGAGKSTLVSMLLRLHLPTSGRILIDGKDLRAIKLESFLKQVGVVSQDTFIFGGTIAENLQLGKPRATETEMLEVLESVGLGPWLASLPEGLGTNLQEGGALSVGQKQRLGIARALLTGSNLMILDEPTSALDATTEREVMATLRSVTQGKTVLIVTHRLDSITYADEIVVLQDGQIVQRGTHEKLNSISGLYADMRSEYHAIDGEEAMRTEEAIS